MYNRPVLKGVGSSVGIASPYYCINDMTHVTLNDMSRFGSFINYMFIFCFCATFGSSSMVGNSWPTGSWIASKWKEECGRWTGSLVSKASCWLMFAAQFFPLMLFLLQTSTVYQSSVGPSLLLGEKKLSGIKCTSIQWIASFKRFAKENKHKKFTKTPFWTVNTEILQLSWGSWKLMHRNRCFVYPDNG